MSPEFREYLLEHRRVLLMEIAKIEQMCGIENKVEGLKRRIAELEADQHIMPRARIEFTQLASTK